MCDLQCYEVCDTASVLAFVGCIDPTPDGIPTGFDPHLGEVFDPLALVLNPSCGVEIDESQSSLSIYDVGGDERFVYKTPIGGWDGRLEPNGPIVPINQYYLGA